LPFLQLVSERNPRTGSLLAPMSLLGRDAPSPDAGTLATMPRINRANLSLQEYQTPFFYGVNSFIPLIANATTQSSVQKDEEKERLTYRLHLEYIKRTLHSIRISPFPQRLKDEGYDELGSPNIILRNR
jgi:hypothetical protein